MSRRFAVAKQRSKRWLERHVGRSHFATGL
jgi:hypothetical protein